jgi:hypothetical protein
VAKNAAFAYVKRHVVSKPKRQKKKNCSRAQIHTKAAKKKCKAEEDSSAKDEKHQCKYEPKL